MRTLFFAIYIMENSPGTFSKKAIHQEKPIVMGISESNPLAKLVIAPSFFTLGPNKHILTQLNTNFKQIAILLYPHLWLSIFYFVLNRENHLTYTYMSCFLSEIDHDNGTVKHILSHLYARYEQYKDCFINHRHRVYYCCINC